MAASAEDAEACPLTDLPAACLRGIAQCLWPDARDAASFACCCSSTRTLCDDQLLWRELLVKRYGERVIPGIKPTPEQIRPAELEGFVFYQGQDGSEETDMEHGGADLAQLAKLTEDADAEAFTTGGKVIKCLKPQATWQHSSFRPMDGMYVRQAAVQYKQLQEPQPASDLAGESWPPNVPGWVYFPSCVSPGHHLAEPHDSLSRYQTLQAVLHAASQRRDIVAVTTEGETKTNLRPQACWEVRPRYDMGLFVRASTARLQRMMPSPAVPNYRQLCSKLQQLRLDAAHMTCAWLNDQYLILQQAPDSPADSGMALVLHDVWWLDVKGSIPGVPPGCYEVAWVVDLFCAELDNVTITLSAEAVPVHGQQQQQQQEKQASDPAAAPAAAAAAAAAAASKAPGAQAPKHNKVEVQQRWQPDLSRLQRQQRQQGAYPSWGVVSGGVLQVSDYSTVQLRFSSTDNTHKAKVRWAMVELIPVEPQQALQQQQQQRVAAQRNRVWHAAASRGRRPEGHGGAGDGGAAGDAGYVRGVMGWLERMFGQRIE